MNSRQLLDPAALQGIMDAFHGLTGLSVAVSDLQGDVIGHAGCSEVCTRFHRRHPISGRHCKRMAKEVEGFLSSAVSRCENHMPRFCLPVVFEGSLVGKAMVGGFFPWGEPPDRALFEGMADQYGFSKQDYLAALERVPLVKEEGLRAAVKLWREVLELFASLVLSRDLYLKETEAKEKAIRELSEKEALLSQTLAITKAGGWKWDILDSTMTWTDETYRIHDLDKEDFCPGDPVHISKSLECYSADDRACVLSAFERCATEGEPYELELPFRTAKGRNLWVKTAARPVLSEGKVAAVIGNIVDITDQKALEEELRAEREMTRLYLDTADAIIVCLDAEGRITMINRYGARLLGFESDLQLLGRNWFELALPQPEGLEKVYPVFQRIMRGDLEGVSYFENHVLTSSGGLRLIGWRNAFLRDSSVNPSGTLSVGLDLTDARAALEERQRLKERLVESRRLESLGRLAGGAAHHFNNMLGVILGAADLALLDKDLDEHMREQLDMISKTARRAADITRQMLTFAMKQSSSPRVLDLNEAVEKMIPLLKVVLGDAVFLEWRPGRDLPRVTVDPLQLNQVLEELCSNARDAMQSRGRVTIETATGVLPEHPAGELGDAKERKYVLLRVADTGCGIKEEDLPRLFDPFYTTKASMGALGMGLATVHGIVTQNKGLLEVKSTPGKGAAFSVYLPAWEGKGPADEGKAVPAQGDQSMALLVVFDPLMREMGKMMLERAGLRVIAAGDAEAALNIARSHEGRIDLLLADTSLPDMAAEDLALRISSLIPGVKILYASDHTSDIMPAVEKPFSFSELARRVRAIMNG